MRFFTQTEVSAIGYRSDGNKKRAVAVNWNEDESSEIDVKISGMILNSLESNGDLDAHRRILPDFSRNRFVSTGTFRQLNLK